MTIIEFTEQNAKLARTIAKQHGFNDSDAIRLVDLSLGYQLAARENQDAHLAKLLAEIITEEHGDSAA